METRKLPKITPLLTFLLKDWMHKVDVVVACRERDKKNGHKSIETFEALSRVREAKEKLDKEDSNPTVTNPC
jgi:hypothetical protein